MKDLRRHVIRVTCVAAGLAAAGAIGFSLARRNDLLNDFASAMQLRLVLADLKGSAAPQTTLQLLDIYEAEVRKQMSPLGCPNLDWKQELIEINLRRYIVHSDEHRDEVAEQMLVRAATIFKNGVTPTKQDIDFFRGVAIKAYSSKP